MVIYFQEPIGLFGNVFFKAVKGGKKVLPGNFPGPALFAERGIQFGNGNISNYDGVAFAVNDLIHHFRACFISIPLGKRAGVEIEITHQRLFRSAVISCDRVGFRDDSRFRNSEWDTSEAPFFLRSGKIEAAVADRVVAASFFKMSDLVGCALCDFSCVLDAVGIGHLFFNGPS